MLSTGWVTCYKAPKYEKHFFVDTLYNNIEGTAHIHPIFEFVFWILMFAEAAESVQVRTYEWSKCRRIVKKIREDQRRSEKMREDQRRWSHLSCCKSDTTRLSAACHQLLQTQIFFIQSEEIIFYWQLSALLNTFVKRFSIFPLKYFLLDWSCLLDIVTILHSETARSDNRYCLSIEYFIKIQETVFQFSIKFNLAADSSDDKKWQ